MSDPNLRKQILEVLAQREIIEVCTYRELKIAFGVQGVSNRQFNRALGRLCSDKALRIYHVNEHVDRGHADYRPRIVSLYHIDKDALAEIHKRLYRRYLNMTRQLQPALV